MGACHTFYDELRFDVSDPHQTHVYCYIRAVGDCPHFIQGWHHKAFPAGMSTKEIFDKLWVGPEPDADPVLWPLKAPPSDERNRALDEVAKVVCEEAMDAAIGTGNGSIYLFEVAKKIEGMKS